MKKVADYLKDAGVFYLATMDGDQPRVRPFGAVSVYNGEVYFCTNNKKNVFKQLVENEKVEISGLAKDNTWIRLTGRAVVDSSEDARRAMLEANPMLNKMYSVDDGIFEVFYLKDVSAKVFSFTGGPVDLV